MMHYHETYPTHASSLAAAAAPAGASQWLPLQLFFRDQGLPTNLLPQHLLAALPHPPPHAVANTAGATATATPVVADAVAVTDTDTERGRGSSALTDADSLVTNEMRGHGSSVSTPVAASDVDASTFHEDDVDPNGVGSDSIGPDSVGPDDMGADDAAEEGQHASGDGEHGHAATTMMLSQPGSEEEEVFVFQDE